MAALLVLLALPGTASASEAGTVRFNRDVRPILSANCFQCHGPDEGQRKADLRLDREEGIREVFVPGRPGESEAWRRITAEDEAERMPPPEAHRELEKEQIETVRRWIEQGATWEGHWAFLSPTRPPLPDVERTSWPRNAIDAFVLARLEREGLSPSPPAERERLIRRITFDLTGLPPTIPEIDAFVGDERPDAYERLVDRLLASPRFGERMTLAWMDAARYGDSSVFHADGPRDMWPWRDWVIDAYNTGKPFDEFTVEQLAGDLLPDATTKQHIATGFHRNNATTDEGGAIAEEYRVEYAVDRVKTTSMVWLGLTMECGQCHDHKYDPISQREYYQFFAYFNQAADPGMQTRSGNQAPVVEVPNRLGLERASELEKTLEAAVARREEREADAQDDFVAWVKESEARAGKQPAAPGNALLHFPLDEVKDGKVVDAVDSDRRGSIRKNAKRIEGKIGGALQLDGQSFVDLGDVANFERSESFSYGAWVKPEGKASGAPIARMDDRNRHRGYDLYFSGGRPAVHIIHSWPDNALKVTAKAELAADKWQHVFMTYDGSSKSSGVKIFVDGKPQELDVEQDRLRDTARTDKPLYIGRRNPGSPFRGAVDDVRVYARQLTDAEVSALAGADPIGPILATPAAERTPEQVETLRRHYLHSEDELYRAISREIADLRSQIAEAQKPLSTVMVMDDVDRPRMTYILARGNYDSPQKDQAVEPGTPSFLPPVPEDAPQNRLGLARWLVRSDHPLTTRVAVNRYWHLLFGTGIVETVEDFGSQGAWPSHPDLLDWLAVEFVESGWSVKHTIRQIVTSATYRQSSRATPELRERDPANRLLARGPRFRLAGEFLRDNALAASGLLVDRIGGPGVKPYQPPGLWNEVSLSGNVRFVQDHGAKLYRRSMYTYWKRSAPAPSLTIFDAPSREKCTLRRSRTNTPLQALVTLNDPQFVEAARALAERVMTSGKTSKQRLTDAGDDRKQQIARAYRLATGVRPQPETLSVLAGAYREELAIFREQEERASALLSIGESPRNEGLDPAEHAAMTVVCSMILNLDETLTRM